MTTFYKLTKEEKQNCEAQIVNLSKQGYTPTQISIEMKIGLNTIYYVLATYKKKNPQERAHITMRIVKLGKENVKRDGERITKNVTTQKVLTYGVHSIILDDKHPRKIYLQANGNIHVE